MFLQVIKSYRIWLNFFKDMEEFRYRLDLSQTGQKHEYPKLFTKT